MPRAAALKSALRLSIQYGTDLALAYVIAVADTAAILIPMRGHSPAVANADFAEKNTGLVALLIVLGTISVAVIGPMILAPTLRWYTAGNQPTPQQRDAAMKLAGRQSALLAATWAVCGVIVVLANTDGGAAVTVPISLGVLIGGAAAAGTGLLLAQRTLRPIMSAATRGCEPRLTVPGVFARLMLLWFLCSALPLGVITAFVAMRSTGWLVEQNNSLDVPILVVSLAALLLGMPLMILTSRGGF